MHRTAVGQYTVPSSAKHRLVRGAGLMIIAAVAASCGSSDGAVALDEGWRLRVVARPAPSDTIDAAPAQAIVVEVTNRLGVPVENAEVVFEGALPFDSARAPLVGVCSAAQPRCLLSGAPDPNALEYVKAAILRTDAAGRARATVQYGVVVGRGVVRIRTTERGLVDSLTFTVLPGAEARTRFRSADTMLVVGDSLTLRANAEDRAGNVLPTPISYRVDGSGSEITYDTVARRARGVEFGTARIVATGARGSDTIAVHVVPRARLLAWVGGGARRVRMFDTDGGGVRDVLADVESTDAMVLRFSPSRRQISIDYGSGLTIADTTGEGRRALQQETFFSFAAYARLQSDGSLLMLATEFTPFTGLRPPSLWRIGANGARTRLSGEFIRVEQTGVDVADDGSRLVYPVGARGDLSARQLVVYDVATGAERNVGPSVAYHPRLSPNGTQLAYLTPTSAGFNTFLLHVVNVDGTGQRQVSAELFRREIAWSPDGTFMIAMFEEGFRSGIGTRIVRMSDGKSVPLVYRGADGQRIDYFYPDWR